MLNRSVGEYEFHLQERSASDFRVIAYNSLRSDGYRYLAEFSDYEQAREYLFRVYRYYKHIYTKASDHIWNQMPLSTKISTIWDTIRDNSTIDTVSTILFGILRCLSTLLLFPIIYAFVCLKHLPKYLTTFFAETHVNIWYSLKDIFTLSPLRDAISVCMHPRQEWLSKELTLTWQDKPELITDILFANIIHFVEQEGGLGKEFYKGKGKQHFDKFWTVDAYKAGEWAPINQVDIDTLNQDTKNKQLLTDIYIYITKEREAMIARMREIECNKLLSHPLYIKGFTRIENLSPEDIATRGEYLDLTKRLYDKDLEVMHAVVDISPYLWS